MHKPGMVEARQIEVLIRAAPRFDKAPDIDLLGQRPSESLEALGKDSLSAPGRSRDINYNLLSSLPGKDVTNELLEIGPLLWIRERLLEESLPFGRSGAGFVSRLEPVGKPVSTCLLYTSRCV